MSEKIYIEKCINCNGHGKGQIFDKQLNRWVRSDNVCKYCNGKGKREYLLIINGCDFMKKKIYIGNNKPI